MAILTDPVLAYSHGGPVERYTVYDLPEVLDCVLITHGHQDHLMLETLLQLRHRVQTVVVPRNGGGAVQDPSLKLMLQSAGFPHVVEVNEFDEIDFGSLRVRATPFLGEHADLDIKAKTTYVIEAEWSRMFFGADTCNVEPRLYDHVREFFGAVDTVFLGMECDGAPLNWLYGPLATAPATGEARQMGQSRRLSASNCTQATNLVRSLEPTRAYVYSMGQEPWLKYLLSLAYAPDSPPIVESDAFVAWCRERGVESERLFGMKEMCLE